MILGGVPRELEGTRTYVSIGKEPGPYGDNIDTASWLLSARIEDTFGETPATVGDIYYRITRQMGMSASETAQLVKVAKSRGYLKWGS